MIFVLLGVAASRRLNVDRELISIGEMIHRRPKLLQLGAEVEKWDSDVLGLIDEDSYTGSTKAEIEDQNVDIVFANHRPAVEEK